MLGTKYVYDCTLAAADACLPGQKELPGVLGSQQNRGLAWAKSPTRLYLELNICMEPPWPLQMPVFLPNSSAMISRAGTSLLRAWTWSRYVEQM